MPKDETSARVEAVYQHKRIDWERRFKRSIDSKVSWDLHEEARLEVAQKLLTRRKRTSTGVDEDRDSSGSSRRSKRRQDYRGAPAVGRFKCATLGDGVEIKKTTLPGASTKNKGLFATRTFAENELITEYTGALITRKEALELRAQGKASHVKGINYDFCIDGDQNPINGQGVAQFANDATRDGNNNSKFEMKFDFGSGETRCFVKALKQVNSGDEVFVGYGTGYWIMDPATGEKIYDENAHEAFAARNEKRQKLEHEHQKEKEERLLQKKKEAKAKREQQLREKIEQEATRQAEIKRKAAERAEARRQQKEALKSQKQAELELIRAVEKKQKDQLLAKDRTVKEAQELARQRYAFEKEETQRIARKKEQETARAKKKVQQEAIRKQNQEMEAEKDRAKVARTQRIDFVYKEMQKKWEEENRKPVTNNASWEIYAAARAQIEEEDEQKTS